MFVASGVEVRNNFMMESCRWTGLGGVLCSLSLLSVILDIQLDGKSFYIRQQCINYLLSSFTNCYELC